jgi:putative ATP-dependent endonuclease of the OLD family
MKISKIKVRNYRSIKEADIELDSFSIFVGQNNHGKTNLFEAIEWFYNAKSSVEECYFEKDTTCTRTRLEDVSQYKDKNPIGQMLSGVLTAIVEDSQDYRDFRAQFQKLFEDDQSEVRVKLNELGTEVGVYLKKQFPDDIEVRFNLNPPQFSDLLKSFDTSVNDGVETKAQSKGDGMQRAIMLAIIQAFADFRKKQSSGSSFLFLIDEAELHLHPSAQRLLKKALADISESDQVMLNTHSSVLVVNDTSDQKLFKVEKLAKETHITEAEEVEKVDIIFDLLGGSPYDLLLPRNFLIVEGKSEFELLTRIVKRHYNEEFKGLKVLFAGGDVIQQQNSIEAVDNALRPLVGDNAVYKDRLVVLLDKPNATQQNSYDRFKQGYPYLFSEGRVFELTTNSLEESYPGQWQKTPQEVETLQAQKNGKKNLAIEVAEAITKESFESDLKVLFDALTKCNEKAFSN